MTARLVYAAISVTSTVTALGILWDLRRRPDGRPERRQVVAEAEQVTRAAAADLYATTPEETDQS